MQHVSKLPHKPYARDEYDRQRLPESSRTGTMPGHGRLNHSTTVKVAGSSANPNQGDRMRRLNKMFQNVAADEMPTISRGRAGKDHTADPLFVALKGQPVNPEQWFTDGTEYSEDAARKVQSKIALLAKHGAGTFKTSYRGGKVYICKTAAKYTQQRGV